MDFIFIKSSKAGKEDYGSIYARVRTGKANMKVVTGFTIKQLEWEKYRSLQYTSSALMSSIGIKYGQFAQVLARIKAAFEADGFNPKEAKNIIESVKHDVLNGMMQIVEVKPKGRMLFEDFLTSYIEDMETGRRTKKGRTVKVSPAYIKGLRIIQKQILNYQKETHRKLGLDDMTMETRNSLVGYWKERGLMPNAINSYMTDVRTVAKAAYEDGADYLGTGAIFPTTTHVTTKVTPVSVLNDVCRAVPIPVVAIGGLNADNMDVLSESPIAGVAVVSAVMKAADPAAAAAHIKEKFDKMRTK